MSTPPSSPHTGRSSMRMSIATRRPSLDLKHVFPQTDTQKQLMVHHERVFEGMVEDVILTGREQEQTPPPHVQTDDDVVVLLTDDEEEEESNEPKARTPPRLARRHSSYESRRRRQGMRDHDKMKQLLEASTQSSGKGGTATSRLELLEHMHDISMDLSQMMKSSTTMGTSYVEGSGDGTLAESCPVLSYIMEDEEDTIEMSHGRRRRTQSSSLRRRRRKNIPAIPEDENQQQQQVEPSESEIPLPPPKDDLKSYTVELPDEEEEENIKPRGRRNKVASYHMLMTSMQMADDINDVTSILESFSSLHSSSKDVMHFPSPSMSNMRKSTGADSMIFKQTLQERFVTSLAESTEADKPGALAPAPTVAMGYQPMVPTAGIARGA